MEHTPGIYTAEKGRLYAETSPGNKEQIAFYGNNASCRPQIEHEPTGRLLAAAPTLLAALEDLVVRLDEADPFASSDPAFVKAEHAIEMAKKRLHAKVAIAQAKS